MNDYLHVQKLGRNLRFLLTKSFVDLADQMRASTSFHDFYYLITLLIELHVKSICFFFLIYDSLLDYDD